MSQAAETPPQGRMTRAAYRAWAEQQPRGRFELVDGEVVMMAAERVGRLRVKAAVWLALRDAIRAAGLPCEAFPDGATVEVGADTDFEPDATVCCGAPSAPDTVAPPNPIVVVEVLSPGSRSVDTTKKFAGYFRVPSIVHYLVVDPAQPLVVHHRRDPLSGEIGSRIVTGGPIALDPPGLSMAVESFYAP